MGVDVRARSFEYTVSARFRGAERLSSRLHLGPLDRRDALLARSLFPVGAKSSDVSVSKISSRVPGKRTPTRANARTRSRCASRSSRRTEPPPRFPRPPPFPARHLRGVPTPRASVRRKERNKMFTITAMTHRPFVGSSMHHPETRRAERFPKIPTAQPRLSVRVCGKKSGEIHEELKRKFTTGGASRDPRPRIPEASFPEARRPTQQSLRLLPG